jgi:signal transduction histidine kinase
MCMLQAAVRKSYVVERTVCTLKTVKQCNCTKCCFPRNFMVCSSIAANINTFFAVILTALTVERDILRRRKLLKEQLDNGNRSKYSSSASRSIKKLEMSVKELNSKLNKVLSAANQQLSRGKFFMRYLL